jgi:hypothetical protein
MIDQDHRVSQRGLELPVVEVVDGLEVVASSTSIKVRSVLADDLILPPETLLLSLIGGEIESLGLDFFPVLYWLPALLALL